MGCYLFPDCLIHAGIAEIGSRALCNQDTFQAFPYDTVAVGRVQAQNGTTLVIDDPSNLFKLVFPFRYDADTICQRVTSRVRQGSIVLFHNAALHTPEALPAILTCLINDGYTVVPISQLILPQPYTIDHTGRQFPAETGA